MKLTKARVFPLLALLGCVWSVATGQEATPEKFSTAAAAEKGCDRIPYESLMRDCRNKQDNEVKPYCDQTSCTDPDLGTRDLVDKIGRRDDLVKRVTDQVRDFESKLAAAKEEEKRDYGTKLSDAKSKLSDETRGLEELKKQLNDRKIQIQGRIYKGEKCREARKDVDELFSKVAERVEYDKERGTPELKEQGDKLLAVLKRSMDDHGRAMLETQNSINACKDALEGRR